VTDDPRLLELRRRIQEDPASSSFADLAEELRRAGSTDEAIDVCRSGLVHHPDDLAARVTLGRALIEAGRLDEAFAELTSVLDAAPGNLPAIRALAEIYQRRGMMSEALVHYRRALQVTQDDTDAAHPGLQMPPAVHPESTPPQPAPLGDLFDFDSLLAQLDSTRAIDRPPAFVPLKLAPSVLDAVEPSNDDAFAEMERQLREKEEARLVEERQARQADAERRRLLVLQELEEWLAAIATARRAQPSA
jgi:tetratricopeptide (TPR) repeat protein